MNRGGDYVTCTFTAKTVLCIKCLSSSDIINHVFSRLLTLVSALVLWICLMLLKTLKNVRYVQTSLSLGCARFPEFLQNLSECQMFLKTLKNERYVQTSLSLEEYRGDYVNVYVKFTFLSLWLRNRNCINFLEPISKRPTSNSIHEMEILLEISLFPPCQVDGPESTVARVNILQIWKRPHIFPDKLLKA